MHTPTARRGMVVAPHHLAAQAGLGVLRDGGNALEAMVAAAATIAVVYPHMNSLGGDNVWLVDDGSGAPVGIDACGPAAAAADIDFYRARDLGAIPSRGPAAANTVAGAVAGWLEALEISARWGGRLPPGRLLEDALHYAREGFPVTASQHADTAEKGDELRHVPGFAAAFLSDDEPPAVDSVFRQPALAGTLERLGANGLADFYRGEVAAALAADLEALGSPLGGGDLRGYRARRVPPLSVAVREGTLFNLPPPTQGLAALMTLALFDRIDCPEADGFDHVHALVEACKCAFRVRDAHVTDPAYMEVDPRDFLESGRLDSLVADIDPGRAAPWGGPPSAGDTVWLGAIDGEGRAVGFIQSLYWEFGSGVVLPATGIVWQNRGTSFSLSESDLNVLRPGRKPFHTIQPALARLGDGRVMVYGAMGGDGQPQTQAAVFSRYARYGQGLQQALTAPRWLLGRTWGAETTNLKIEDRFPAQVIEALAAAGHDVEVVGPFDPRMGHAGALVRDRAGVIHGAADPRGDGVVAAF